MDRISFLNTYIDNLTMAEAVEEAQHLIEKKENSYIVTPNLDHIVILEKDKEFAAISNKDKSHKVIKGIDIKSYTDAFDISSEKDMKEKNINKKINTKSCLLYTSDAADEL